VDITAVKWTLSPEFRGSIQVHRFVTPISCVRCAGSAQPVVGVPAVKADVSFFGSFRGSGPMGTAFRNRNWSVSGLKTQVV